MPEKIDFEEYMRGLRKAEKQIRQEMWGEDAPEPDEWIGIEPRYSKLKSKPRPQPKPRSKPATY